MKQPDTFYNTDQHTGDINHLPTYIATYSDGSYIRHYPHYEYITPEELTAIWSISTKHKNKQNDNRNNIADTIS